MFKKVGYKQEKYVCIDYYFQERCSECINSQSRNRKHMCIYFTNLYYAV